MACLTVPIDVNWFYKLKPRLGCSNVSKDKKVLDSNAREEISWVESIWTYKLYQLFWLFKRQHGKCVLSNGL